MLGKNRLEIDNIKVKEQVLGRQSIDFNKMRRQCIMTPLQEVTLMEKAILHQS